MVKVSFDLSFEKRIKKINDVVLKDKIKKQISKVIQDPECGKPMRYSRKGTRELYISPYRLSYIYFNDEIVFLDLYHKDNQ